MLSLIPWPGPTIFKISCPRENARIVRKIVQTKWIPVLDKYKVNIFLDVVNNIFFNLKNCNDEKFDLNEILNSLINILGQTTN